MIPSERSIAAWIRTRSRSHRISSIRGRGRSKARRARRSGSSPRSRSHRAAAAAPSSPVTHNSSPGRAPLRVVGAAAQPSTVTSRNAGPGDATRSPPRTSAPTRPAISPTPRPRAAAISTSSSGGSAAATTRPTGAAAMAARSLNADAAARYPIVSHVIHSRRKWTPSTLASQLTTTCAPSGGRKAAASSPTGSVTVTAGSVPPAAPAPFRKARMRAVSGPSASAGPAKFIRPDPRPRRPARREGRG